MFNTIRRSILFCLIIVAAAQSVYAEDLERWQIDDKLYDADKAELTGGICWNANVGDAFYYEHENGAEACIALDLKTGEWAIRYPHEGYIIQHDSDEYSGALFAVERNGHLTITHEDASGTSEIVYECDDIQPIEHYGRQTVRAYIRGSFTCRPWKKNSLAAGVPLTKKPDLKLRLSIIWLLLRSSAEWIAMVLLIDMAWLRIANTGLINRAYWTNML